MRIRTLLLLTAILLASCDSLVELDPPKTEVIATEVFKSDATASAALTGMYSSMITGSAMLNLGYGCSLSADENNNENINYPFSTDFGNNTLSISDYAVSSYWTGFYQTIYQANSIIENTTNSTGISAAVKTTIIGEAKFVRALNFFYLVNLFGPVPLTTTTAVKTNQTMGRTAVDEVYTQIITDLKDAETKLPDTYSNYSGKRDRPNKKAATALLAKVYLYTKNYAEAEIKATEVINEASLYRLLPNSEIKNVFLKDSEETIFALNTQTTNGQFVTNEAYYYYYGIQSYVNQVITASLIDSFEPGDTRKTAWAGTFNSDGKDYFYGAKYKDTDGLSSPLEYSVVLRLAELYLIRAEARGMQNDVSNAVIDLNTIRNRAGLTDKQASSKSEVVDAVMQERRTELFLEYGNRWFDLKRTDRADAVLGTLKPSTWKPTAVLYPIPLEEIKKASQLTQNAGY